MAKSGLILFLPALAGTLAGGIIICCCGPIWAVVVGVAAGYLAGVFVKPADAGSAAGRGAGAGAIAGVGALIGQILASLVNNTLLQQDPETARELYRMLGIENVSPDMLGSATGMIGTLLGGGCWGMLDLLLIAAFGALGGFLWFRFSPKKAADSAPLIA
ncbi:MAG: hypothetical protein JW748_15660 [Anaerolineales bacterium]|nr:hypothetical protein [Anaerolineales bacterium]